MFYISFFAAHRASSGTPDKVIEQLFSTTRLHALPAGCDDVAIPGTGSPTLVQSQLVAFRPACLKQLQPSADFAKTFTHAAVTTRPDTAAACRRVVFLTLHYVKGRSWTM